MKPLISIIIPTRNEVNTIADCLHQFTAVKDISFEVIISDSSDDLTPEVIESLQPRMPFPLKLVYSPRGRARQMNRAAKVARGSVLLFLHADTRLPKRGLSKIAARFKKKEEWGGFYIRFAPNSLMLRLIAMRSNFRIRFLNIVFGDQALFVSKKRFRACAGFPDIPLMEDIALSRKLKKTGRMGLVKAPVTTSSRRFMTVGIIKTYFILMPLLIVLYKLGVDPKHLNRLYYGKASA